MNRRISMIGVLVAACSTPGNGVPDLPVVRVTLANPPADSDAFSFVVAYQDGANAWQLAPPPVDDVYSLPVTSSTWAFAWTRAPKDPFVLYYDWLGHVHLYGFTVAERTELSLDFGAGGAVHGPRSMGLFVTNPPAEGIVAMAYGPGVIGRLSPSSQTTTEARYYVTVVEGTYDLLLGRVDPPCASSTCESYRVTSALAQRNVDHHDPTLPVEIDFGAAEPVRSAPVTVTADGARVRTILFTASGTRFTLVDTSDPASGFVASGLAASFAKPGDIYLQEISVPPVRTENWQIEVAPQTYIAPTDLAPPTASWTGTTIATTWSSDTSATGYEWVADQFEECGIYGNGHIRMCDTRWTAMLSADFLGDSPSFQTPDLASLAGWNPRLSFKRREVTGTLRRIESSRGAMDLPPAYPAEAGTQRTLTSTSWILSP